MTLDPTSLQPACELATPTLSALDWAQSPRHEVMPARAVAKMKAVIEHAPRPGERLKAGQPFA